MTAAARRTAAASAGAALATALAGCASYENATFALHDARTSVPIANAAVTVSPTKLFIPAWPYWKLNPAKHEGDEGVTDADGRVTLRLVSDGPSEVRIDAAGYAPFRAVIEPLTPHRPGEPQWWLSGDTLGEAQGRSRLTVQVVAEVD